MGTIYHVAILVLQSKPQMSRIWKFGFRLRTEARDRPLPIRDCLARASGTAATAPWSDRAGPPM